MRSRWLIRLACVLTVAVFIVTCGCSAERNRRRAYSVRTDLDHMVDDFDWMVGLDEPSILYEETFPPYTRSYTQ
jgi:hypothetical protein